MQRPYFQIKDQLRRHGVTVFSSNYTLYGDMSQRVQQVLNTFAQEMEVYSIDESFIRWSGPQARGWDALAHEIRDTVFQWTGLPVGVGVAPTKTLAKLANHLSKRAPGANGVHILDNDPTIRAALGAVELTDIWGISSRLCRRFQALGIRTPLQLRESSPHRIRESFGVVGQRMVYELRGDSCIELETARADKQNICCSRSFGEVTNNPQKIREAVCTFVSHAAMKLRKQDLAAGRILVFIQTDFHAPVEQYAPGLSVQLPSPTNDTRELARHAGACLRVIFRPEHHYKKAGVLLMDLCKRTHVQPVLFGYGDTPRTNALMTTLDTINRQHGRGAIRMASASPMTLDPCRTWHLRSDHRSPRYTTRWEELPVASAAAKPL